MDQAEEHVLAHIRKTGSASSCYHGCMTQLGHETYQPPSESTGLDEDIPCPGCGYNLRGLTVPRCPECGNEFDWADIPEMRPSPPLVSPETVRRRVVGVSVAAACIAAIAIAMPSGIEVMLSLGLLLCITSAVAGILACLQATLEYAVASVLIGRPTWRRFVTW